MISSFQTPFRLSQNSAFGFCALALIIPTLASAQEIAGEAAGEAAAIQTALLPAEALRGFRLNGGAQKSAAGRLEIVRVENQPFGTALRLQTLKAAANNYAVQALALTTAPISSGDRIQISFRARAVGGASARATVAVEGATPPNVKSGEYAFTVGPEWQKFSRILTAKAASARGGAFIAFQVGSQLQTLEIGDLQIVNVGREAVKLPAQGISLLAPDALASAHLSGAAATMPLERVSVTGPGFENAIRVRSEKLVGETDVKLILPLAASTEKDDVLLAQFWMRGTALRAPVAGRPHVSVMLEDGAGKSSGEVFRGTVPGLATWREFRLGIKASQAMAAGEGKLALRLGIVPQEIEIGSISLQNLRKSVDFKSLNILRNRNRGDNDKPAFYSPEDQKPDAPWRLEANARIDKHRKSDLQISVVDAQGKPIPNAQIAVRMKRHAFPFSTAVGGEMIIGPDKRPDISEDDHRKYREILESWFNGAAPENDLKWHKWNGARTAQSLDWLRERNFRVYGHTLMWGHWGYIQGKEAEIAKTLPKDSPVMQKLIVDHIREVAAKHRGKVTAWDVLNEPYTQNTVIGALGDHAMIEWFQAAREGDPGAQLFLNEFNILEDTNRGQADALEKTVEYLLKNGAPLDGIGLQSHIGTPISPPRLIEILDRFAKFNLPLAITEFDQNTADEAQQAAFMRDFMTATFSHPSVQSINIWGFWEKKHWIPAAALFRADWSLKPNGQAWFDLVHKTWQTSEDGKTGANGKFATRGFLGDYEITVSRGAQSVTVPFNLAKNGQPLRVVL